MFFADKGQIFMIEYCICRKDGNCHENGKYIIVLSPFLKKIYLRFLKNRRLFLKQTQYLSCWIRFDFIDRTTMAYFGAKVAIVVANVLNY